MSNVKSTRGIYSNKTKVLWLFTSLRNKFKIKLRVLNEYDQLKLNEVFLCWSSVMRLLYDRDTK